MLSAKKARQRPLIVSGGDRILSDIEKLWIFTIVKMRFGMFDIKRQPKVDQCSLGAHFRRGRAVKGIRVTRLCGARRARQHGRR